MAKARVFIDGEHGTTGLEIRARLAAREDLDVLGLPRAEAKNERAKRDLVNAVDLVILCLPDAAARATAGLIENPTTRVIDASTAHRTAPGWVYGFAELTTSQRAAIASSRRIANPGCFPTGFLAVVRPLRERGVLSADARLSVHAVSGYSGGGRKMIEDYENATAAARPQNFGAYGLNLEHKHLAEMRMHGLLEHAPIFAPAVGYFARGMLVAVPLHYASCAQAIDGAALVDIYREYFANERFIGVHAANDQDALRAETFLEPEDLNGSNRLELFVYANDDSGQALVIARLDNLGKGASGAAVQNLNLALGLPEAAGLS
jgi:N-acetyl-gamma-glutamyl-phosphate reductase